ncbi:AAA family ATPase [Rhodobacteraceae bacterium NNCM2]|nr:AAA family ATPase [Coraliihabitans acroporae]
MLEPVPDLPAIDFSDDQMSAWQTVVDRLNLHGVDVVQKTTSPGGEADRAADVIAITGKAGSGKTVLLARIADALAEAGLSAVTADWEPRKNKAKRSFAVLAPTNKAASVLRDKGVRATTIHRIVYTPVYDPEFEQVAEWLQGDRKTRPTVEGMTEEALDRAMKSYTEHGSVPGALAAAGVRGADFITGWTRRDDPLDIALVDEASMIDERQMKDLGEIFSLIILFGDPAQLAPVNSKGRMVFDTMDEGRVLTLSRIHRQSADNPILDLAHALADPDLSFESFEDMVRQAASNDDRVRIASRADATLMQSSPVLVWRNKTRIRLIHAFRTAHGIAPDVMVPGEPLICDGLELPLKQRKQRIDLEARGLIKGAQATYLGTGRKAGFARVDILGTEEPGISVAAIIQIESPDEEEPRLISAARMGALFLHGAAVTTHKAQGSQWPEVQVFAPDLWAAARSGNVEAGMPLWKRLAYVAITRAEERLIWVTRYMISRPEVPLGTPAEE